MKENHGVAVEVICKVLWLAVSVRLVQNKKGWVESENWFFRIAFAPVCSFE